VYLGKRLHKIHGDIGPDPQRHGQRLEKACGVEGLGLVPLACGAHANIVADDTTIGFDEQLGP
jgi:hypothetical protein